MKRMFLLSAAVVSMILSGCQNSNSYRIDGIADGVFNGQTVYLMYGNTPMDSATVNNGTFTMSGDVEDAWIGTLATGDRKRGLMEMVVEKGCINVDLTTGETGGTELNDGMQLFLQNLTDSVREAELESLITEYYEAADEAGRATAEKSYDSVYSIVQKNRMNQAWNLYNGNKDNALGVYAMGIIATDEEMTYDEMVSILATASDNVKEYPVVKRRMDELKAIEATSVGKHYTDIVGVDGKLSDIIDGKLALVDFYASWCGPCKAEIRDHLVPLWEKYKKRGLVVVGVNVWERGDSTARAAAHERVMEELGITYPQLVDSTRFATTTYGISGIPEIMLVAPDGTILARGLRGKAIEEAVVNALMR